MEPALKEERRMKAQPRIIDTSRNEVEVLAII